MLLRASSKLIIVLGIYLSVSACSGIDSSDSASDGVDRSGTLNAQVASNIVRNFVVPTYEQFVNSASALKTAIDTSCTGSSTEDAWNTAMSDWQATLFYSVGPTAPTSVVSDGAIARIYTISQHNINNANAIDNAVNTLKLDPNYSIPRIESNFIRGLDALEYLLFVNPGDVDRCNYAKLVVNELQENANIAVNSWTANTNAGISSFLTAQDSASIAQVRPFFNIIIEQTDKNLKDTKLGNATKLSNNSGCGNTHACPELVEHRLAQSSYASLKANLNSLKDIFTGGSGQGFDDIFAEAEQSAASDAFVANIDKAIASIDAQGAESLFTQLAAIETNAQGSDCQVTANPNSTSTSPAPCAIYREVKALSDFLKTDFAAVVNLDVPSASAGDGD